MLKSIYLRNQDKHRNLVERTKDSIWNLSQIVANIEAATELWEIEDDVQDLWNYADNGDIDALALYGLVFLMEGRKWYDLEEGRVALKNSAEAGSAIGQYYYGRLLLESREGLQKDPIEALFWIKRAKESGLPSAIRFWKERWG